MANGILALSARVTGVALDGVNNTSFHFLHDTDMIGNTVAFPVEEDQIAALRSMAEEGKYPDGLWK